MKPLLPLLTAALLLPATALATPTDAELAATVAKRLSGDRTGACFAVAVVEATVARAYVCAQDQARAIGPDTAFEIGSVSKTMTAALLAKIGRAHV